MTPNSYLLTRPAGARALLLLAHGAGAGMTHPFLAALAAALADEGVATLRYQFPYMEAGGKRPDPPKVAMARVQAAAATARELAPELPLFAGGKSFGSRMSTMAAAAGLLPEVRGLVCFGFPLHAAKKPSTERAAHLAAVPVPVLFLQGTRDALAEPDLMRETAATLPRAQRQTDDAAVVERHVGAAPNGLTRVALPVLGDRRRALVPVDLAVGA